jgi:type I restriction enzyme S subunit
MNEPLSVQEAPAIYQVLLDTPRIRQGYKQTEVGVIPEDWEAVPLSRLGQFKNGINKDSEAFGHGSPFVNLMDVFGVSSITSGNAFGLVKTSDVEQKTYNLKHGDVIFIRSSVKPSGVGLTAVVEASLPKTVYSGFLIRFRDNDALDIGFKRHCFYSESFRNKLIAASSVSANTNINQDNLKKLLIALPPTATEQHAIATALSDVDALLVAQDKLIAKNRDIKQAAMQQLLTGKQRLPGFTGEWEVKRLGDVLSRMANGAVYKPSNEFGVRVTRIETIADGTIDYSRTGAAELSPELVKYKVMSGDILFSHINSLDHIGKVAQFLGQRELYHGMNLLLLRANEDTDSKFLYFWFTSEPARRKTRNLAKQAVSQASINTKELKGLEIYMPQLHEQTAIATILSDIDADLNALEQQRDKTRALKQGMMQELLTGRIRLV